MKKQNTSGDMHQHTEDEEAEKPPLFEVHYPTVQLSAEELQNWVKRGQDAMDIILGQYKEPAPPQPKEEEKKEDTKAKKGSKKDSKKQQKEEPPVEEVKKEEIPEEPKIPIEVGKIVEKDNRSVINLPISFNYQQMNNDVLDHVPEPEFPDPEKEPVPEPLIQQILKKPANRAKLDAIKSFTILTPKNGYENEGDEDLIPLDEPLEEHIINKHRWIIPSKKKISLYVKFFTRVPGQYDNNLDFECYFSNKKYQLPCIGLCDYPTINSNPMNIFMQRKKFRPANPPESYISKHFIFTENAFEFGPLLIGKDSSKKNENKSIYVNSSVFRITNNGKFDAEVEFALSSSVLEGPEYKKGVFMFEPDRLSLKVDQTEDIRVWAFPDSVQKFKDDLICMIKNNPLPVVLHLQCDGVKPEVKVD
mmetsp:Transcript_39419/g.35148  ORF Transcript_39419/g.35148 Transcript_39419/m.35148 type:complete len:418 (+) Transcript_39419:788-2041(+)